MVGVEVLDFKVVDGVGVVWSRKSVINGWRLLRGFIYLPIFKFNFNS